MRCYNTTAHTKRLPRCSVTTSISKDVLARVKKLVLLPEEVRQSQYAISVTRLTSLKSLCREPKVAHRFAIYLARKTLERVRQGKGISTHSAPEQRLHLQLMADSLAEMDAWLAQQSDERGRRLTEFLEKMRQQQNEYQRIKGTPVRLITDGNLLLFEYALTCLTRSGTEAPFWAYHVARQYAEAYEPTQGTGLIASAVSYVQDIADFWIKEYNLSKDELSAPAKEKEPTKETSPSAAAPKGSQGTRTKPTFTPRQGQFLAFVYLYRKLHREGPAESDLVRFFRVTPPVVHGMLVKLENLGLISREPGVPRSARVIVPETDIPTLEDVEGPPW